MRRIEGESHSHTIERAVLRSAAARSPIVASWMRSARLHGLDRLFQLVGGVGCCVLLADRDGIPLDRRGAR